MTDEEFNSFCGALPAKTYVIQWRGSHVWKVGGTVFAIVASKSRPITFRRLKGQSRLRPAPILGLAA
jgi:predicted DNA-binding protein (MmcQ/YjbR family)